MIKSVLIAAVALAIASPAVAGDAKSIVKAAAYRHDVPVNFALKVAKHESGLRCGARNKSGATGPLQIMPASARALGYYGNIRRANCYTQTDYGMRHLAMCYRGARGNQYLAAACHYQGVSALYKRVNRSGAAYANKVLR